MKKKITVAVAVILALAAIITGIYFIFFRGSDGGKPKTELVVARDDLVESVGYIEALVKNRDRYKNALSAEFEMGAEKADEFYEAPENWLAFDQIITLKNQSDKDLTVYGFEVKDNGKDGFYVCTKVGGEIGMVPGASGTSSFTILCENGELSVDEAKAAIDKMEIKAIYSRTPEEFDDGTESTEETKTVEIVFPEDK